MHVIALIIVSRVGIHSHNVVLDARVFSRKCTAEWMQISVAEQQSRKGPRAGDVMAPVWPLITLIVLNPSWIFVISWFARSTDFLECPKRRGHLKPKVDFEAEAPSQRFPLTFSTSYITHPREHEHKLHNMKAHSGHKHKKKPEKAIKTTSGVRREPRSAAIPLLFAKRQTIKKKLWIMKMRSKYVWAEAEGIK